MQKLRLTSETIFNAPATTRMASGSLELLKEVILEDVHVGEGEYMKRWHMDDLRDRGLATVVKGEGGGYTVTATPAAGDLIRGK